MSMNVKQQILNQINSQNATNQQVSDDNSDAVLVLLNEALQLLTEELQPKHKKQLVTAFDEDEAEGSKENPSVTSQDLQNAILKMQKRGYDERTAQNEENFNETSESDEGETSSSTSSGMQAVFDLQGWICELMGDATKSNAAQAQDEVEIGNALEKTAQEQYDEIEKKIDKLEKEKKKSSFWGFLKGIGDLVKDIDKLMKDASKDLLTGNFNNLSNDVSSIKNNAAIYDLGNLGKLILQVDKMVFDAVKNLSTGNIKGLKSEGKKDFSKIEENPALGLAIQLLSYAALAASLVGAAATGGALSVAVVAVVAAMAMASSLNSDLGGVEGFASKILQNFGIPQSVADTITKIPSFDDLANEMADILEKMGVPANVAKPIADVGTVIAVALAAGVTGNIGLAFMAMGTAMSSEASQFTKDCGVSGEAAIWMTMGIEIAGLAIACYGGFKMAGSASATEEGGMDMEVLLKRAQKVQIGTNFVNGNFEVMQGAKDIDMGKLISSITKIEGQLSLIQSLISTNNTMMNTTSSQLKNIVSQYDQMIDSFGMISEGGIAAAEALAKN